MGLPKFTAEASLYKGSNNYCSGEAPTGPAFLTGVLPSQLTRQPVGLRGGRSVIGGFGVSGGCVGACAASCAAACIFPCTFGSIFGDSCSQCVDLCMDGCTVNC